MHEPRAITADTALLLGLFCGMEPRFRLNLQSEYDIRVADQERRARLSPRIRVFHACRGVSVGFRGFARTV